MALSLIRELVHPDMKYSPKVIKFFLKSLVNESLNIRKIALRVTIFILIQNKPVFSKIKINPYSVNGQPLEQKVCPGPRDDNEWLKYNSKTVPRDQVSWESANFFHKQHIGYYCWPKELNISAPSEQQCPPAKRMEKLSEEEHEIFSFFINPENIEKLIKYSSLEEKKGKDMFNAFRVLVYKVRITYTIHLTLFFSSNYIFYFSTYLKCSKINCWMFLHLI